jgi:hypothetical protein
MSIQMTVKSVASARRCELQVTCVCLQLVRISLTMSALQRFVWSSLIVVGQSHCNGAHVCTIVLH